MSGQFSLARVGGKRTNPHRFNRLINQEPFLSVGIYEREAEARGVLTIETSAHSSEARSGCLTFVGPRGNNPA